MTDKERYATIGTWVEIFREEGVTTSDTVIRSRVRAAGLIGETARNKVGMVVRGGFYAESEVRCLCSDFFQDLPFSNEEGLIEIDGKTYRTIGALALAFGISKSAIINRINKGSVECIQGRLSGGQINVFYSEQDMRQACADILQELPEADEAGFIFKDGERFGTKQSFARAFGIHPNTIKRRIKQNSLPSIKGRLREGNDHDFYSESEIRRICADYLSKKLVQADENGLTVVDGDSYGTLKSLSDHLGKSRKAIVRWIKNTSVKFIKGKNKSGRICTFYSVADVRDLINKHDEK